MIIIVEQQHNYDIFFYSFKYSVNYNGHVFLFFYSYIISL
jgi:hypothetical protein